MTRLVGAHDTCVYCMTTGKAGLTGMRAAGKRPVRNLILVMEIDFLHPVLHQFKNFCAMPQRPVRRHAVRERLFVKSAAWRGHSKPEGPKGKVANAAIYS